MPRDIQFIQTQVRDYCNQDNLLQDINPVFAPKQHDILRIVDRYWMSRFDRKDFDESGQKKPFFNIIETPVFVAAKQIDLDTKDVRIMPVDGQPLDYAIYFQKELNLWMRDVGVSKLFNKIKWLLPKYGTVVIKSFKDEEGNIRLRTVPLQNLRLDVTARTLNDSHFIAEKHDFIPRVLRKQPWNKDKIEEAIRLHEKGKDKAEQFTVEDFGNRRNSKIVSENTIRVWEFYGELPDTDENFHVIAEVGDEGLVLDSAKLDRNPYREIHWDKIEGRWLGIGVVEKSFETQIHMNRVAFLKSNGLHYTSKHLWQTRDREFNKNLLIDVEDGQVLNVRSPLEPVAMEERNLHAYREEEQTWLENQNRRSFSTDVLTGQRAPAGTPLGSTVLASQQAGSFFEQKREEFGDFIKDILWDFVIPNFKNKNRKEHWLNFTANSDTERKRFDRMAKRERVNSKVLSYVARNGEFPMDSQIKMFEAVEEQKAKEAGERWVKIPESFYDNLKFKLELVLTGESQDLQGKLSALQIAIQTSQNPEEQKQLRNKLLQLVGEEPLLEEVDVNPAEVAQQRLGQQGSQPRVRRPNTSPGRTNQEVRV